MNLFTISELQQFSGVKAHTIRIWEQRYQALSPERSEGNTRYYDNSQLRRLLNIVSLMDGNYKVSELCSMNDDEIFKLLSLQLKNQEEENNPHEHFVLQMIAAGMEYDEFYFEKLFSNCLLRFGLKDTYTKVIYPLLHRLGIMWRKDAMPPAQEHFVTNIIKQKLFTAIDGLPPAKTSRNSWLLFLPENEFHEIGLLFGYYMIRFSGRKAIYLGTNVPFESLKSAVSDIHPSHLFFFMVHHNMPEQSQKYLNALTKTFKETKIHLSGNEKLISQLKLGKETQWIQSVDELSTLLA